MIAVDSNILVYAHRAEMAQSEAARRALAELAEGPDPWALPWPCVHEFLGVVSNPGIFRSPTPLEDAFRSIDSLLSHGNLLLLHEGEDHLQRLRRLVVPAGARGPMVHDGRIAAICLSHGITELWTADRDFSRFLELRVRDPLASRL